MDHNMYQPTGNLWYFFFLVFVRICTSLGALELISEIIKIMTSKPVTRGLWHRATCDFFLIHVGCVGCPGQLTRTTTILHGSLDILQAQEQVRHRGGDKRAHRGSNLERKMEQVYEWPQQLDLQVRQPVIFNMVGDGINKGMGRFSKICIFLWFSKFLFIIIYGCKLNLGINLKKRNLIELFCFIDDYFFY